MVVLVGVQTLDSVVLLEVVLGEQFEYFGADRDLAEADEQATCDLVRSDLVVPGMLLDIPDCETLFRVSVQDCMDEVSAIRTHKFRD